MSPGAIKDRALRWRQKTSSEADPESAPTPNEANKANIRGARSDKADVGKTRIICWASVEARRTTHRSRTIRTL